MDFVFKNRNRTNFKHKKSPTALPDLAVGHGLSIFGHKKTTRQTTVYPFMDPAYLSGRYCFVECSKNVSSTNARSASGLTALRIDVSATHCAIQLFFVSCGFNARLVYASVDRDYRLAAYRHFGRLLTARTDYVHHRAYFRFEQLLPAVRASNKLFHFCLLFPRKRTLRIGLLIPRSGTPLFKQTRSHAVYIRSDTGLYPN